MDRSRKHTQIFGIAVCHSEKHDKRTANRKLRVAVRAAVAHGDDLLPEMRNVSNVWAFGKDGRRCYGGATVKDMQK